VSNGLCRAVAVVMRAGGRRGQPAGAVGVVGLEAMDEPISGLRRTRGQVGW
jgi:hypothetical protein